ncbi:hypothetical protein KAT08_00370 [Candidatus Babeliales bacterium]|nr:hypothetical protein [Candidatus Babeliales bacterium]
MNIKKIILLPILFSFTFNCIKSMQNNNETTYHQDIKTIADNINAIYEFKRYSIKQKEYIEQSLKQKYQKITHILEKQKEYIEQSLLNQLLSPINNINNYNDICTSIINLQKSYQTKLKNVTSNSIKNKQNIKQYKQNLFSIINQDNNKKQLIKNIDNNKNLLNKINEYLDFYHSTKQILIELINETSINNKTINNKNIININKTLIRQYSIIKSYKTILDFILRQYNEYKYIEDIHYGLFQMDNIND